MKKRLKAFDDLFINLINEKMKHKYLDIFMLRVTDLGGAIFSSLFALVLLIFGTTKVKLIAVEALVVLSISQSIVYSLKKLLSRERPYMILEKLNTFGIDLSDYSFPSGHTTASFSIATTLALNIPVLAYIVFIIATIIGISRIYLGVHYPTDVAAGIILGVSSSFLVHYYLMNVVESLGRFIGIN